MALIAYGSFQKVFYIWAAKIELVVRFANPHFSVRTVATWGGSTQCPLGDDDDEDDYSSEVGAEEDDDDEHDEGEESSSTDELHACSTQKQRNYNRNNRDG